MTNYFNSKYPIIALAMNQVSDAKFAIECSNAGIYPSISLFNYNTFNLLLDDIHFFVKEKNNSNFLFSMEFEDLKKNSTLKLIDFFNIKTIELIAPFNHKNFNFLEFKNIIYNIRKKGIILCLKCVYENDFVNCDLFDCLIIKGQNGAGLVGNIIIDNVLEKIKRKYPKKFIIIGGGIENKQQITHYLNNGADAIGIGSLFALSKESCIPEKTKLALLNKEKTFIKNKKNNIKNAIVFSDIDNRKDDLNNTKSLILGIKGNGTIGHVYAGTAVKNIKEIKPLKQIVEELI